MNSWKISGLLNLTKIFLLSVCLMNSSWAEQKVKEKVLHTFGVSDGNFPNSSVTFDKSGDFVGLTYGGGAYGFGTVFRLRPTTKGWKYQLLYSFCPGNNPCVDGANPDLSPVTLDQKGAIYGTTQYGGNSTNAEGTVFKLENIKGIWEETVLYSFCSQSSCSDGAQPTGTLAMDKAGNLYGATPVGGDPECNCGVVFELSSNGNVGWNETVLYRFTGDGAGSFPLGGVVMDKQGKLYGATSGELGARYGAVFQLTPGSSGWSETTIYTFGSLPDAEYPFSGVALDSAGNLYGTTYGGGDENFGTVFTLNRKKGWKESVIHSFTGPDGVYLQNSLTIDRVGNIYGMADQGGKGSCSGKFDCGTAFKMSPSKKGWTFTRLHDFEGKLDGAIPLGSLTLDSKGTLYGTASQGGDLNCNEGVGCGVVFQLTP